MKKRPRPSRPQTRKQRAQRACARRVRRVLKQFIAGPETITVGSIERVRALRGVRFSREDPETLVVDMPETPKGQDG